MQTSTNDGKRAFVFGLLFIGFAIAAAYVETRLDRKAINWPKTIGEVIAYNECSEPYRCGIIYRYEVDGKEFIGNRVMFSGYAMPKGWSMAEKEEWIANEFPLNKMVPVFYNMQSPDQSALLVGVTKDSFKEALVFFSIVLSCIFFLYFTSVGFRSSKN